MQTFIGETTVLLCRSPTIDFTNHDSTEPDCCNYYTVFYNKVARSIPKCGEYKLILEH